MNPAASIAGIIGLTIPESNEINFSTGLAFFSEDSVSSKFSSICVSLITTESPTNLHVSSNTSSTIPPNTI